MKLGEALAERARLQRKIGELRVRINANATKQEDTEVAENPNELLDEIVQTHAELAKLIGQINLTNAAEGLTLQLAERDRLAGLANTYTGAADAARGDDGYGIGYRSMRSELKTERTVDVKDLRKKADEASAQLRTLDNEIQAKNWTTDLI